jgi:hypothetical protein
MDIASRAGFGESHPVTRELQADPRLKMRSPLLRGIYSSDHTD